jgi:predicted amino acid-binding ACT domain protein
LKSRVVQASAAVAASLSLLTLAGCGGDADTSSAAAADAKPEIRAEDFNAKRFDRSSNVVDNAWFPLKPGMQLVFDGTTLEEGERVKHRVIWTISDLVQHDAGGERWTVSLRGADQRGIVHRIADVLASCDANIVDVSTRLESSGEYAMQLDVIVTPGMDRAVRGALAEAAERLGVEMSLARPS